MGRSTLLQWNCRGNKANIDDVDLLIPKSNPLVLCLQEIYLKNVNISLFRKYSFCNKIGSAIENKHQVKSPLWWTNLKKSIPLSEIKLNTKMQAVAIIAFIPKTITICSIYLLPNLHWETKHLEEVMVQLIPRFILMRDFNAHSNL